MIEILQCLKKHGGERLDSEIAKEMGMPLETVRQGVAGLAATGGGHHVQPDALREWQPDRSVAVPRVGLHPACSARSKTKADDVSQPWGVEATRRYGRLPVTCFRCDVPEDRRDA